MSNVAWVLASGEGEGASLAVGLLAMLATAALVATVFRKLKLESIPGFLLAGFLVGPVFGIVKSGESIQQISELATVLLMFIIGLSLELDTVRRGMVPMLIVGAVSTLASVAVATPLAIGFDRTVPQSIAIAMAFSMSSTALLIRILQQRRETKAMIGRLCLGIAISQDILSVVFLALIPPLAKWAAVSASSGAAAPAANYSELLISGLRTLGAVTVLLLFGRYILPRALGLVAKAASQELILIFSAATALGAAIAASMLKFSPELGAFLAGILLASTPYKQQLVSQLSPLKDLLLPIFFMAVGLQVDPAAISDGWGRILLGVAALLVCKTLMISLSAWALGASTSLATLAGFYLWQGGEFSLVMLDQAGKTGLLPADSQGRVIAIVVVSLVIAPLLVEPAHALARWMSAIRPAPWIKGSAMRERPVNEAAAVEACDKLGLVIVAGYGPVGRDIAEKLGHGGWAVSIIDLNPKTVLKQTSLGRSIVYGDMRNPEVLEAAGVHEAEAIVLTVPDDASAIAACRVIKSMNPTMLIAVRTSFLSQAMQARENGAEIVVIEEVVTADGLSRDVMSALKARLAKRKVEGVEAVG